MISVNLLPEEFRPQVKSESNIPYVKIAKGCGILFVTLTLFFYVNLLFANAKLKKVKAEWAKIQPQSVELGKLETDVEKNQKPEKIFLESFVTAPRPLTFFMVWVSEFLPDGVWLTEFQMERKQDGGHLFIKGLAFPARGKSSIESIEVYLNQLKSKIPDANLSLTTTRQMAEGRELTQFAANFEWGAKAKP